MWIELIPVAGTLGQLKNFTNNEQGEWHEKDDDRDGPCLGVCGRGPGRKRREWPPEKEKESVFTGRKLEVFQHGIKKEWGYAAPQRDTFLVLHPKQAARQRPALRRPAFRRA